MCSEREERFLQDFVEAIHRIQTYVAGLNYDEFQADSKTQDAAIRNLEIIDEATVLYYSFLTPSTATYAKSQHTKHIYPPRKA